MPACCLLLLNLLLLTPTCICMPRPCRCPSLCLQLLLTMRLPLVFDLDETLLVAKSQSQMAKELKALRDVRCVGAPVPGAPAGNLSDQQGGLVGSRRMLYAFMFMCGKMQRWRSSSATSRMAL